MTVGLVSVDTFAQIEFPVENLAQELENSKNLDEGKVILIIYGESKWIGQIHDGDYVTHMIEGQGNEKFTVSCGETNIVSFSMTREETIDEFEIYILKDGQILESDADIPPGDLREYTVNCLQTSEFQVQDVTHQGYKYYLIGVVAVIVVVIYIIIKKGIFLGPQKFRV